MDFRQQLTPAMAAGGIFACFFLSALIAWNQFLSVGPRMETEATLLGCFPAAGLAQKDPPWLLRLDLPPFEAELSRSDVSDAVMGSLCEQKRRVRVVTRSRQTLAGTKATVKGLEDLDQGMEIVSEQEWLAERRLNRAVGTLIMLLSAGLGVATGVNWLRDARERARLYASAARPRSASTSRAPPTASTSRAPPTASTSRAPVASRRLQPTAQSWLEPAAPGTVPAPGPSARAPALPRFRLRSSMGNILTLALFGLGLIVGAVFVAREPIRSWPGAVGMVGCGGAVLWATWRKRPAILEVSSNQVTLGRWFSEPLSLWVSELTGLALGITRTDVNGVPAGSSTSVTLVAEDGRRIDFEIQSWKPNAQLVALHRALLPHVMVRLLTQMRAGQEVPWGEAFLTSEGVRVGEGDSASVFPLQRLRFRLSEDALDVAETGGLVLVSIPKGALNFGACLGILQAQGGVQVEAAH